MFPIRILEGAGYKRVAAASGEIVAEIPAGYEVASAMVRGANNYPALIERMKDLLTLLKGNPMLANSKAACEARNLLAYLGEPA
jgi:hypothetical protein